MPGPVTFVYADWIAAYPNFSLVNQAAAQSYFNQAGLYLDNTGCSPVYDADGCCYGASSTVYQTIQLTELLYMLTAHIAWLFSPRNAAGQPDSAGTQPPSGIVGRISQATEGTVSVSSEFAGQPGSAAWFQQTPWGAAFWAATAQFRTFRYVPGPPLRGVPTSVGAFPGYRRWARGWCPGRY